jgi:hypothetical protein
MMKPRHADPVPNLPSHDPFPELLNFSDNLMSWDDWVFRRRYIALDRVEIRMTNTTCLDPE